MLSPLIAARSATDSKVRIAFLSFESARRLGGRRY
jgi:hypothetical protein